MNLSGETSLAWIGTGVMGSPMCRHLLAAGYPMHVYSRTKSKAQPCLAAGAQWAESPQAVAEQASVVFTMLGFPDEVRTVILGEKGVLAGLKPGGVVIDMTTTAPSLSKEIAEAAQAQGGNALDAPVSGGDVGAKEARLSIMVGGEESVFEKIKPLFELLGKEVVYQGPAGCGQHSKLCNQMVVAGQMIGVCEALLFAQKTGLNPERVLQSIAGGAAGCWTLDNLAPRILKEDFRPGFFVDHFVKDMGLALEESARLGLELEGLKTVHRLYQKTQELGYGQKGTHALMLALQAMAEGQ